MHDYYKDLEKRIELQENQIQHYCKQIETLEKILNEKKVVYKVDWANENELTFNYSVSETFEGACKNLLTGVNYYKIRKANELLNDTTHTNDDILTLKYWHIFEEVLTEYENGCQRIIMLTIDKRLHVYTSYRDRERKIFCKMLKEVERKK